LRHSVLETISTGRKVADMLNLQLIVALIGPETSNAIETVGKYGTDKICLVQGDNYFEYNQEVHAEVLKATVDKYHPQIILFSATTTGKELAPRLAAKLDASIASDITDLHIENGEIFAIRPVYAGKTFMKVAFKNKPIIVSLRPKLFSAVEVVKSPLVENLEVPCSPPKAKIVRIEEKCAGSVDLTEADIIVSGGRGVKGPEGFAPVKELAEAINGVVGASRAAVDAGWIDHSFQVGQTGKNVNPQLYIACGISGAVQHLAGMRSSKVIVAINKDPEAPIFKIANYGIVGDLFEIVPALTMEVKKLKV
jgi:electron transfer flavoprotein alpha subunit